MERTTKIVIALASIIGIGLSVFLILKARKKSGSKSNNSQVDTSKNFIIGDSQTPLLDRNSQKALRIGEEGSEANLWKGGKSLSWLKDAVDNYQETKDVNSIIINIGTNGGFNASENIQGLVNSVKSKFPNAKIFAVKGSWGWGGNKNVTQSKVDAYYEKFRQLGVELIPTAIGVTNDPHTNLPVYAQIGSEIDARIG